MRKLLVLIGLFISINSNAQFFKEVYKDFLKYGTFYVAGDVQNAYEETTKDYFVRKPEDGNLYDVPEVIDVTEYYPNDYRLGVGFRKLARFDYEVKAKNYYDGTENNKALSAPTAAVKGLEYLLHYLQLGLKIGYYAHNRLHQYLSYIESQNNQPPFLEGKKYRLHCYQ